MPSESVLAQKKGVVEYLTQQFKDAESFVLADYRGLTVEQDSEMRATFRKEGLIYKVYKNTLIRFAAKANGYEELSKFLEGPTAIIISLTDPVAPSKLISQFAKKYEKLEVKAGVVEGNIVSAKDISEIAEIPPREVLIAKLLGSLNSPITGFVNVLNGNLRGLVVALDAIREKKEIIN
jgi:large subunit ribosomal protein L10